MHELDGPLLKIQRARVHLLEVKRIHRRYLKGKPYSLTLDPQIHHVYRDIRIHIGAPPSSELSLAIGDFAYALRSCLDQLMWQLALKKTATPKSSTQFPIFDIDPFLPSTESGVRKRWKRQTVDVWPSAIPVIKSFQPYARGNFPHEDLLWVLNAVCNSDKHERLTILGHEAALRYRLGRKSAYIRGLFNDNDVVTQLSTDRPNSDKGFKPDISAQVIFQVGAQRGVRPFDIAVLDSIYAAIKDDLLPRFASFFP